MNSKSGNKIIFTDIPDFFKKLLLAKVLVNVMNVNTSLFCMPQVVMCAPLDRNATLFLSDANVMMISYIIFKVKIQNCIVIFLNNIFTDCAVT